MIMAQTEDYEFPTFVEMGAKVYTRDNRYNISRREGTIVKILKRAVDVEFTKYDGTVQIKRFQVESYGHRMNEVAYKGSYVSKDMNYRDRLVSEQEALTAFATEDHNKEMARTRHEIEATAKELAGRWIDSVQVEETILKLKDLGSKLKSLEEAGRRL